MPRNLPVPPLTRDEAIEVLEAAITQELRRQKALDAALRATRPSSEDFPEPRED